MIYPELTIREDGNRMIVSASDKESLALIALVYNASENNDDLNAMDDNELSEYISESVSQNYLSGVSISDLVDGIRNLHYETAQRVDFSQGGMYELELDSLEYAANAEGLYSGSNDDLVAEYNVSLGLADIPYAIWETDGDEVGDIWYYGYMLGNSTIFGDLLKYGGKVEFKKAI